MSVRDEIAALLCEVLGISADELKFEETLYDSIGVDSTEMVEVRVAIKKKMGVDISDGELTNKQSVADIVKLVEEKKN